MANDSFFIMERIYYGIMSGPFGFWGKTEDYKPA
jgi:hypothetical protein